MYAIYDLKDNEQCIGVFDNVEEIAKYFNTSSGTIRSTISRKEKKNHRYLIKKIKGE